MIRFLFGISLLAVAACAPNRPVYEPYYRAPGQGQYVRPDYLNPAPLPVIPAVDACQSQLYRGLVGQPEGAIYIPGLPGAKRVIKPAYTEAFDYEPDETFGSENVLVEVRDYLPGQTLYAPSIRAPEDLLAANSYQSDRLTIELDRDGLVQEIRCG